MTISIHQQSKKSLGTTLLFCLCVISFFSFSFIVTATLAHAQMYKWVDAQGKVHFSDKPPPATAKQVQNKGDIASSAPSIVNLPPELTAAVKKNPVTLYTTTGCGPCNSARTFLKSNGVPFSEKTVTSNEDIAKLKQVSGDNQLPEMIINKSKFQGYEVIEWREALSAAGYPETNKLPKDYAFPEPEPAVKLPPKNVKETEDTSITLTPNKTPPSGIRF